MLFQSYVLQQYAAVGAAKERSMRTPTTHKGPFYLRVTGSIEHPVEQNC